MDVVDVNYLGICLAYDEQYQCKQRWGRHAQLLTNLRVVLLEPLIIWKMTGGKFDGYYKKPLIPLPMSRGLRSKVMAHFD